MSASVMDSRLKEEVAELLLSMPSSGVDPIRTGWGHWTGHIPFAFDVVSELRPQLIVELGSHLGESYFAFCQAVREQQLQCRCYAVDNWEDGDAHMGTINSNVYESVHEHNQIHYSGFSYLLRMDFAKANQQFSEGTIDLLHIDGYHTYDAVKRDFETWYPKVRDGGIILFHDVSGRHQDFGVWQFWEEITRLHDGFCFYHSWGLGVLRKGAGIVYPSKLLQALFSKDPPLESLVRQYYSLAGDKVAFRGQWRKLEDEKAQLLQSIAAVNEYARQLERELDKRDIELRWLKKTWNGFQHLLGRVTHPSPAN